MVSRRKHSAEFRVQAVRLMRERLAAGLTLQRISEELDVGPDLLRYWGKQVDAAPAGSTAETIFPGGGRSRLYKQQLVTPDPVRPLSPETPEAELSRLRRENERLRQERDFLKKAAAFFAKESR